MTRKKKSDMAPSSYEIRVGMSSPFVVVEASSPHDFDPVQAFQTLAEAVRHFPSAKISDAAKRKAAELAEPSPLMNVSKSGKPIEDEWHDIRRKAP